MSGMLDFTQWDLKRRGERYKKLREIIFAAWNGDNWEGKVIGLNLPLDLRNRIDRAREKHGLGSAKETVYKMVLLGLDAFEELPACAPEHQVVAPAPTPIARLRVSDRVSSRSALRPARVPVEAMPIEEETSMEDFDGSGSEPGA